MFEKFKYYLYLRDMKKKKLMDSLDRKIYDLHNYLQKLLKWSNSLNSSEKTRSKQLFADIWLFDLELLQFIDGKDLPEWDC